MSENQKKYVYASEADILNVALFGMTAKEWRNKNPKLAKRGNIRDSADLLQLIILNNLENLNAEFIKEGLSQTERLERLNSAAHDQIKILAKNHSIAELQLQESKVNSVDLHGINRKFLQ